MHILLVEDNPSDVRLLKELMEEEGYCPSMHWVMNGRDAMDYIFGNQPYVDEPRPDVVLLDLGLPRISGYEILKDIKLSPEHKDIYTVVLTTSRNPLDQEQCKSLGADAFVSKPRNLKEYKELVVRMVNDLSHLHTAA